MCASEHAHDHRLRRLLAGRSLDVAILIFPEVEVLDFAGPFEVFSVAGRILKRDGCAPFRVSTVAAERRPVVARHGLPVTPNACFADRPAADILIVPGGIVTQPLEDARTLDWIRAAAREASLVASVCTGAFILARLGLLAGRACTTHWEDIPDLRRAHPDLDVREDVPFVDEGAVVTSAGISAGIGMSLHLVARILGAEAAQRTARQMQYDWSPPERAA
ncbi:MAG TPA: DJ-1/PfpI family protein [Dongiaceae bacterium]|nr:DJ-1/PfpI family protein [Dongiaceae bacterium]